MRSARTSAPSRASAARTSPRTRTGEIAAQQLSEIPVVSVALGAVAGYPAAQMAATHFSVMGARDVAGVRRRPAVVERALGMPITKEDLGGYLIHSRRAGSSDNDVADEAEALAEVRRFLSYLRTNVWEAPPVLPCDDPADRREEALLSLVPRDRRRRTNARKMVTLIGTATPASRWGATSAARSSPCFARWTATRWA